MRCDSETLLKVRMDVFECGVGGEEPSILRLRGPRLTLVGLAVQWELFLWRVRRATEMIVDESMMLWLSGDVEVTVLPGLMSSVFVQKAMRRRKAPTLTS